MLLIRSSAVQGDLLYTAAIGTLPPAQGWSYLSNPLFNATSSQSLINAKLEFNSSAVISEQAGYFAKNTHPFVNALGTDNGFSLNFNLKIIAENHSNQDRSGFSVLIVTQSLAAIELGFWNNEIWAQNDSPLFTHGESATFNTSNLTHYQLTLLSNDYVLTANNTIILAGKLRDYSAFTGFPNVYVQPNLLFFGDNSSRGSAHIAIESIALTQPATLINIPLPTLYFLVLGLILTVIATKNK